MDGPLTVSYHQKDAFGQRDKKNLALFWPSYFGCTNLVVTKLTAPYVSGVCGLTVLALVATLGF